METTFTTDDGVRLYGTRSGAGTPLVLVHGSWTDSDTWGFVVDALARSFEVVTYDRRGHSRSSAIVSGPRRRDQADLIDVIEQLGGGPAHVVGNSYGASIALGALVRRPDLFRSAAVHEPPLLDLLRTDPAHTELVEEVDAVATSVAAAIDEGRSLDAAEEFVERIGLGPGGWALVPEAVRGVFAANAPTFLAMLDDPGWGRVDVRLLRRTPVPLLLTAGDTSAPVLQVVAAELARWLPLAPSRVLPGVGHVPHLTHPEQYVEALAGWIAATDAVTASAG